MKDPQVQSTGTLLLRGPYARGLGFIDNVINFRTVTEGGAAALEL